MGWQFIVNPFLRRDKIIVSHFSPFLFYLYVLASVQRENCLARDKSIPAIPNMPWFHWKKWFVLRQARKHSHRPSQSHHGHCQWKWPEGKCPSRRSFVLAMMHRHTRPPHPPKLYPLAQGLSPIEQRWRHGVQGFMCGTRGPFQTASAMVGHCYDDCCWPVIRLF